MSWTPYQSRRQRGVYYRLMSMTAWRQPWTELMTATASAVCAIAVETERSLMILSSISRPRMTPAKSRPGIAIAGIQIDRRLKHAYGSRRAFASLAMKCLHAP